jgi:hypothetical protein
MHPVRCIRLNASRLYLDQVRAVLEEPVCNSLNGKHSWWSTGFAYGVWTGVMRALGIDIQVTAKG